MSYSARAIDGTSKTVAPTYRIDSIAGEAVAHYLTDVIPCPVGGIRPSLGRTELVTITPLSFAGGTVTPGTAFTLRAQVELLKARRHSSQRSPDMPETVGSLLVLGADQSKVSKLLDLRFADALEGRAFSGCYVIQLLPPPVVTVAGNPLLSLPATTTPASPVTLTPLEVDLTEQWVTEGNARRKLGDARIVVDRGEATLDALIADGAFLSILAYGKAANAAELYRVTGRDGTERGITMLPTYHWQIYLTRVGA